MKQTQGELQLQQFFHIVKYMCKDPDDVFISDDATVPTTFEFKSPVYLEPETEYALVLKSSVADYKVWISRLGEG